MTIITAKENNGPFTRNVHTDSLGNISVSFYYYPEERETEFEPWVPAIIDIDSVNIDNNIIPSCALQDIDFIEIEDALWKLLDTKCNTFMC